MICITGKRPVIQIGEHHITGYETDWIDCALYRAARRCNREDFPFIIDIRNGIIHYLENRCPLRVITIEKLYDRMRGMLIRIGCQAIADNLDLVAPPIKLSLPNLVANVQAGYELFFHDLLQKEILELRSHGVEELKITGSKDCTRILKDCETWDQHCEQFHQELLSHLDQTAQLPLEKHRSLKIQYLDL